MSAIVTKQLPRGVRNCNPLNLEYSPEWQGLKPDRTDSRFCEFVTMARGWRAAFIVLSRYKDKYNIDTINAIIARWAPAGENDVQAYIDDVCKRTKFAASETVDLHNFNDAAPIALAMAVHENGDYTFKQSDIIAGATQAGLENVPRGVIGSAVKTVAPAATAAAGYAVENTDWLVQKFQWLQPMVISAPAFLRYGFWGMVGAVCLAIAMGEYKKYRQKK